jgi:hypothetical protein
MAGTGLSGSRGSWEREEDGEWRCASFELQILASNWLQRAGAQRRARLSVSSKCNTMLQNKVVKSARGKSARDVWAETREAQDVIDWEVAAGAMADTSLCWCLA